jgi:hypothetical protein
MASAVRAVSDRSKEKNLNLKVFFPLISSFHLVAHRILKFNQEKKFTLPVYYSQKSSAGDARVDCGENEILMKEEI